jgi:hypothetical protein
MTNFRFQNARYNSKNYWPVTLIHVHLFLRTWHKWQRYSWAQRNSYQFVTLPPRSEASSHSQANTQHSVYQTASEQRTRTGLSVPEQLFLVVSDTLLWIVTFPELTKTSFCLLPSSCFSTFCNVSYPSVSSLFPPWNSKTFSLLWLHVGVCPKLIYSSFWVAIREFFQAALYVLVGYEASYYIRRYLLR